MKNIRKRRKPKQFARSNGRAIRVKSRHRTQKKKIESGTTPWLRILSASAEDDPREDVSGEFLTRRNGRRQPPDLDLYIPEHDSRGR